MAELDTKILRNAKELIERGWARSGVENKDGCKVDLFAYKGPRVLGVDTISGINPEAEKFSVAMAVFAVSDAKDRANGDPPIIKARDRVLALLNRLASPEKIGTYDLTHTKEEVLNLLDKALEEVNG